MLSGRMMEMPLTISSVIDYAADVRSDTEVVSQCVEGGIHRYNYAAAHQRTCQLAHALKNMGIKEGDRVATLAWNGHRHFELYFAISGIGSVCHTINPRLFADQIVYIINHANDRVLFLDINFIPIITPLIDRLPKDLKFVALCDRKNMPDCEIPDLVCFEDLLAGQSNSFSWPTLDERSSSALWYTS